MIVLTATEFKAKCLQLLDRVKETGEHIQITKRGVVVAEVAPPREARGESSGFGLAKGKIRIVGDIMEPLDVEWEAMK
ncbi:MAG: type II toxin-antitoxin system Phd/YefM family antitoxin [Fimbriimonadaceae bacterium]|nr:type II toxin-antitoxin system Phd/YefM family antitoxin [Fimbriimonadaceae bacterium]